MPARTPCPVIPPPPYVKPGPTRDLLAALYEHGWYAYPASGGRAELVSPDHTRSLTVHLIPVHPEPPNEEYELLASHEGERMPLPWAIRYVRGDK